MEITDVEAKITAIYDEEQYKQRLPPAIYTNPSEIFNIQNLISAEFLKSYYFIKADKIKIHTQLYT